MLCPLIALAFTGLALAAAPAARAIPRLDLSGYPAPAAGDRRWVIQLPGLLRPSADGSISANPRDWSVELIVGQTTQVDCNQYSFSARLRSEPLAAGQGPILYRVSEVGPLVATRMACPGMPPRERFVPMAGKPFLVPYNVSVPIVLDAPTPLQLRWRLWKAETNSQPALALP